MDYNDDELKKAADRAADIYNQFNSTASSTEQATASAEQTSNTYTTGNYSYNNAGPTYNTGNTYSPNGSYSGFQSTFTGEMPHTGKKASRWWKKITSPGSRTRRIAVYLVIALLVGCIGGGGFALTNHFVKDALGDSTGGNVTLNKVEPTKTGDVPGNGDVISVVQSCMPSVVSITNRGVTEVRTFFGNFQQESESSGSGVIIGENDNELLIVTNFHVVANSQELTVVFSFDEKQNDVTEASAVSATVKGYDSSRDLAIIAVKMSDLSKDTRSKIRVATLGNSADLQLGQEVVAIGNALGYGQSVTNGIISALAKEMTINSDGFSFSGKYLQTNAAINPGNSGGALLNMNGELVGINSAKIVSSSVDAVGYAIPIDDVVPIIEKIINKASRQEVKESQRGYLGISGQTVPDSAKQQYGMPDGVYVASVVAGSGAEKAGLSKGCIITALDGTAVKDFEDLQEVLKYFKAGEKISAKIAILGMNGYTEENVEIKLIDAKTAGIETNN